MGDFKALSIELSHNGFPAKIFCPSYGVKENRGLKTLGSWNRPVSAEKAYLGKEFFGPQRASFVYCLLISHPNPKKLSLPSVGTPVWGSHPMA